MKKLLLVTAFIFLGSGWALGQSNNSSAQPPSGMSEVEAYSIYYENYRGDSYEGAIRFGRWIWKGMPEKIEGYPRFDLKRQIGRLVTSYSKVAEKKQDPSLKEAYVDTALMIFDKGFERFDDEETRYDWYIKRGRLYQTHSSVLDNASVNAAENYASAFKINPKDFTNYGQSYYIKILLQEYTGAGKKDEALAIMKQAEQYASEDLKSFFNEQRQKLFDSPEEQITFLEGRLEENPESEEILNELRNLYQDQEMMKKASELSDRLYEVNPNYKNTMAVANDAISNANYNNAVKYLKEAMDKASGDQQRAEIAMKISNAYLNSEQLQQAREFANQAADYDSDWGKPYIQIADVYAQAVSQCTSDRKMDRKDKVVYWLVLDYLDQAKSIDPNTANEVERKYKPYSDVTPTTEEKFFWEPPLEKGDEFTIDSSLRECYGWINETTTVR